MLFAQNSGKEVSGGVIRGRTGPGLVGGRAGVWEGVSPTEQGQPPRFSGCPGNAPPGVLPHLVEKRVTIQISGVFE
jgi:predicted outer membrane repeat protein